MKYQLSRVLEPAAEPVTLAELKEHLRIDTSAEDSFLSSLIASARSWIERSTGRVLITQTWQMLFDAWPTSSTIFLPRPPLMSVSSVKIYDADGVANTLSPSLYLTDINADRPRIVFKSGTARPQPGLPANGIEIEFVSGYGDLAADIPPALAQSVKLLAAHWYEKRELVTTDGMPTVPLGINAVLGLFRSVSL